MFYLLLTALIAAGLQMNPVVGLPIQERDIAHLRPGPLKDDFTQQEVKSDQIFYSAITNEDPSSKAPGSRIKNDKDFQHAGLVQYSELAAKPQKLEAEYTGTNNIYHLTFIPSLKRHWMPAKMFAFLRLDKANAPEGSLPADPRKIQPVTLKRIVMGATMHIQTKSLSRIRWEVKTPKGEQLATFVMRAWRKGHKPPGNVNPV
ncbi:MAG: hypothetical protein M1820_008120 [Bogoriella megaspora]|nr:MAG: hypothetical protein M1820_008120 [Bogoriella megaspora]